ncbi:MAG: MFS transporter, partial [Hyphomicrobiaceae bacterium]
WFDRGFGIALGLALTGASVGGALLPPIIVQNSTSHGFDETMFAIGSSVLAIMAIAVLVLALIGRPRLSGRTDTIAEPYSMRVVIGQLRFWAIAIPTAFGLGGQVGFLAHQVPLIAAQTDQVTAALMVTVVAIASAIGRLLVGLMSRTISVTVLAAVTYLVHGAGIGLLALAPSAAWIVAGCAVSGLTVGAIVMLPPLIVRHVYGTVGFGRTYALVNVVMYVLAGLSPWFVGLLRDGLGDYTLGLWLLVAMEAFAAICVLAGLRRYHASQGS